MARKTKRPPTNIIRVNDGINIINKMIAFLNHRSVTGLCSAFNRATHSIRHIADVYEPYNMSDIFPELNRGSTFLSKFKPSLNRSEAFYWRSFDYEIRVKVLTELLDIIVKEKYQ